MIAVAGLTVSVVLLAGDTDEIGTTSAAEPIEPIRYGDFNPATGRPAPAPAPPPARRHDGAGEDGTGGAAPKDYGLNSATGDVAARGSTGSEFGTSQQRLTPP